MPNWSCSRICFKGDPKDIKRLSDDIEKANEWKTHNQLYFNLSYFFYLNGFDTISYKERYKSNLIPSSFPGQIGNFLYDCNFRGDIYYAYPDDNSDDTIYVNIDSAWWTDYNMIQIICLNYNLKFGAFSEESGMGIYNKCKNSDLIDVYDYDYYVVPDYDELEEAFDNDSSYEMDYELPAFKEDIPDIVKDLNDHNVSYELRDIEEIESPTPYGVYYGYIFGVIYDQNEESPFTSYTLPGVDKFNNWTL